MLSLFKDADLTRPAGKANPKWFLFPQAGGMRESSLWLGDTSFAVVRTDAEPGSDTLELVSSGSAPESGTVSVAGRKITYSGKTTTTLTGIPASGAGSIASTIAAGTYVYPSRTYASSSNLGFLSRAVDPFLKVSLKTADSVSWNFPTTPVLFADSVLQPGDSLLGRYTFAEAGAQVFDSSGNELHGTPSLQAPERCEGIRHGTYGLHFDGTCYVDFPAFPFLASGSLSFWICPDSADDQQVFSAGSNLKIEISDGKFGFRLYDDSVISTTAVIPGRWTWITLVWDGDEKRIYVNGAFDQSTPGTGFIDPGQGLRLGGGFVGRLPLRGQARATQASPLRRLGRFALTFPRGILFSGCRDSSDPANI
jgi:hypothetical protein